MRGEVDINCWGLYRDRVIILLVFYMQLGQRTVATQLLTC
jgi:hypothetical protein